MGRDAKTHTNREIERDPEIENPVGLSRHYDEKEKIYVKKKTNERSPYFLHLSLDFSLENSMLSFAKTRCAVNQ